MYNEFFGLEEAPFSIAPDPRYLFLSPAHREALAHLVYGLRGEGGIVLLTGEVGTGKTTICRCLLEQLPEDVQVALILNPSLTVCELLASICDDLGVAYPAGNTSNKVFIDALNRFLLDSHARGLTTVLVVDEAQNLSADVLEQLRLLTNLETSTRKLLQIVLIGQPELRELLARPELRQIAQRITARYHLGCLKRGDVGNYLRHRLAVAGGRQAIFTPRAVSGIYRFSKGIPRLVNVLSDRALLGAYAQGRSSVGIRTVRRASREVSSDGQIPSHAMAWLVTALVAVFVVFLVIAGPEIFERLQMIGHAPDTPKIEPAAAVRIPGSGTRSDEAAFQPWPGTLREWGEIEGGADDLLRQWGVPPTGEGDFCRTAAAAGLECLEGIGGLDLLRHLDRPALLRLSTSAGEPFSAVLVGFEGQRIVLACKGSVCTFRVADLERHWLGHFVLLWRPQLPGARGLMRGDRGAAVAWLAGILAEGGAPEEIDSETDSSFFDARLEERVKQFQLQNGLSPDGIVGPHTLILLNRKQRVPGPRLGLSSPGS